MPSSAAVLILDPTTGKVPIAKVPTPTEQGNQFLTDASLIELIRDTVGGTLVAGSGVTITVDDPGNTVTIASTGGGGGGGAAQTPADAMVFNVKAINMDPTSASSTMQPTNTTIAYKMYTPLAITLSQVVLSATAAGSSPTGHFAAIYGADGALIAGSGSADFSSLISPGSDDTVVPLGATVNVPAGFFYVLVRFGAGTPQWRSSPVSQHTGLNFGLSKGSGINPSAANAPRVALISNTYNSATPPSNLGTLGAHWQQPLVAVR